MKKCPACSREYRDVVSQCPFDGAMLAVATADEPAAAPTEIVYEEPPTVAPLRVAPAEIVGEEPTQIFDPQVRLSNAATPLEPPPPAQQYDPEETLVRFTVPVEQDAPPEPDYRPNAANVASLPHPQNYAESDRHAPYNAQTPPVIPPFGPGPGPRQPVREVNPWRYATFALAGLIVVFMGAWFFLSGPKSGNANDPLAVDPNSANVSNAPPVLGTLPPPDANFNSGNFNIAPLPGAGAGPSLGGPSAPFPSAPPPSLTNMNGPFPPPVINSNVPNSNVPNFNTGGVTAATPKPSPTPKPAATPAATAPTPGATVTDTPKPAATPGPPKPAASPKPAVKPVATPGPPEP